MTQPRNCFDIFKGRKRKTGEALWADEEFKDLKKKKALSTLEEQQVRIQLMKNQSALVAAQQELVKAQTELVKLQSEQLRQRYCKLS